MSQRLIARRNSIKSNIPFDPLTLSPSHWFKMYNLGLSDGATVTSLPDSSGNARNIASGNIIGLTFKTNIINSQSIVRGAAGALAVNGSISRTSMIFIVAQYRNTYSAVEALFALDIAASWRLVRTSSTDMQWINSLKATTPQSAHVYTADLAAGLIYVDGSVGGTGTPMSGSDCGSRFWRDGNNVSVAQADIGEVLIYPPGLTSTNRAAIEAFLKTRWATP